MRKCRSCGYLLLGEADACGRCGTPLQAVTAGAPAPAAVATASPVTPAPAPAAPVAGPAPLAPAFGRLSIPPPGGPATPVGATPPSPPPALVEQWQPVMVAPAAPAHAPRTTRIGVLALVVVILLAAVAGVMHLRSDPLPAGTSAFVAGGGVTYTSPDGAYQVQLPTQPETDQNTISENGVSATIYSALVSTDSYEIGAASIVFPSSIEPDRISAALDSALTQGINGTNGKLVHKDLTMRGTLPAIEGQFKAPDGYSARMLVVARGATMILIAVHAKSGTDRLYKALEAQLLIR